MTDPVMGDKKDLKAMKALAKNNPKKKHYPNPFITLTSRREHGYDRPLKWN